jgi:hypothetical protein
MILEGDNAIQVNRDLMVPPTSQAAPGTIRRLRPGDRSQHRPWFRRPDTAKVTVFFSTPEQV